MAIFPTVHFILIYQQKYTSKGKRQQVTNGKNVIQNKSFMALLKPIQNHGHCSNSQPL